jgi:ribosome-associated protein
MENSNYNNLDEHLVEAEDFITIRYDICKSLDANKSEDIVLIDLKPQFGHEFWFIIGTALSNSHLKKLAQDITYSLKKRGIYSSYVPNDLDYESGWVALDYGEIIVHIFMKDKRTFYNLEGLWKNAIIETYPK